MTGAGAQEQQPASLRAVARHSNVSLWQAFSGYVQFTAEATQHTCMLDNHECDTIGQGTTHEAAQAPHGWPMLTACGGAGAAASGSGR